MTKYLDEIVLQSTVFGGDEYVMQTTGFSDQFVAQNTEYNDEYKQAPNS